jgi:hypothetical protein
MNAKRAVAPSLGVNCTVTVPLPEPDALPWNAIHGAVVVAVQAQPDGAVTVIVCVPPLMFRLVGDTM